MVPVDRFATHHGDFPPEEQRAMPKLTMDIQGDGPSSALSDLKNSTLRLPLMNNSTLKHSVKRINLLTNRYLKQCYPG